MAQELLILMARYPTPGKVKTRLARDIGVAAASKWYRRMLFHFRREFHRTTYDVEWWYTPARAPFRRLFWLNLNNGRPQPPGNLGERMQAIFADAFTRGYRRVVMIGTDAPEMSRATVRAAFRLLRTQRVVIQPTTDGGYALLGLSEMVDVFTGMPWSTDQLATATRRRVKCAELPPTYDVDTIADLRAAANGDPRRVPPAPPRTRADGSRCPAPDRPASRATAHPI
jgi:rSAM/selenodomain-associated transferase 1